MTSCTYRAGSRRAWSALLAAFMLLALLVSTAGAVTVSNLNDSGGGSLRDAVINTPSGGLVDFAPGLSGTIALASEIVIAKSLTLDGAGASITVSGGDAVRIFDVTDGNTTLTVRNLVLANGFANAGSQRGGAIATTGALVVDSVTFTANRAADGGGAIFIARTAGTLGSAAIQNSVFSGNAVTAPGGVGGGALLVAGDASSASVASLVLQNSTVSGNSANASIGMSGGGIAVATASLIVISSTIAANHAGDSGADVHQGTLANTSVTLRNSIIGAGVVDAAVLDAPDRDLYQPGGMGLTSAGHNVVQQRSLAVFDASDAPNGTAPQLLALANNGGATLTQAIASASPARDFVPLASCVDSNGAPLTRDQRGGARGVANNPCDAGAFEAQTITLAPLGVPGGMVGVAYSQSITATGGVGAISFTLGGTLPSGVLLNASTGAIAGTPTQAGTFNFTVTASDAFGASSAATPYSLVVSSGVPARLAFVQQPSDVSVGSAIAPAVVVQVQDAFGNPLPGAVGSVTLALGANPGGSTLSGTLAHAVASGSATFANLSLDQVGAGYTLVASFPGVPPLTSAAFNVVAGAPAALVFGQQPTNAVAGAPIAPAVTVRIVDANGNPTSASANVTLALASNPGSATLSGTLTVAAVNGTATLADLSLDKVGTGYTLLASSTGLTAATSTGFNVTAGAPAHLVFVQQPSTNAPNVHLAPVSVQVVDAFDNVSNAAVPVTIAIGNNPGGGTLSGTVTVTASNGVATFATLSIDKPGVGYTLIASSGALPGVTSAAFDITNRVLNVALPGGESVTLALSGGGSTCNFVSGGYVPVTGGAGSPPAGSAPTGYVFTYGLATFTAAPCVGSITLTYTYPEALPTSAVFWKYGPTAATPAAHWYQMPATISGNTVVVTIADGGLGDDDLTVNGTIVDPSGVGVLATEAAAAPIPTLDGRALAMLIAMLLGVAGLRLRAMRRSGRRY